MKKRILGAVAVIAIVAMAAFNMNVSADNNDFSALTLSNIEALAGGESGGGSSNNWACWSQEKSGSGYWRCGNPCQFIDGYGGKGTEGKCYKN